MKLYRIAHVKDGEGPFNSAHKKWTDAYGEWRRGAAKYPPPSRDGLRLKGDLRCACACLKTLFMWVGNGKNILARQGFKVVEIEVDGRSVKVGKSGIQVVYPASKAKVTKVMTLNTAMKLSEFDK